MFHTRRKQKELVLISKLIQLENQARQLRGSSTLRATNVCRQLGTCSVKGTSRGFARDQKDKMRVTFLLVALAAVALGKLAPLERPYKILMLLPVGSKSHKGFFTSVADALGERGHKVVMLSSYPASSKNANVTEIDHGLKDMHHDNYNLFESRDDPSGGLSVLSELIPVMVKRLYRIPEVKELYEKRKTFDLIIVDHMINEMVYPFVHERTYMTISAFGMDACHSAVLGNVQNPAYVSGMLEEYPSPLSLKHRFLNLMQHILMPFYLRHWSLVPKIQQEISDIFPDLPPLLDIERNQSLTLINSHFSIDVALPLLPSQVAVGAIHCRPANPLPKNLEAWISGAGPEGVVYFSLGTVVRGTTMPVVYRDMFVEAFKRLKQRVIWKYEEELEGVSDNVLIQKWLPQQDILGHPNVRLFISHGGLLSTQESLYHGTPVVALPVFADQPKNAMAIQKRGVGVALVWEELSVDLIVNSIQEVMNNPKYNRNAEEVMSVVRDQPETPRERAVFWTEYVVRHQGAPRLRSPAAKLSWVEFLMLDVLLVLHVVAYVAFCVLSRVVRAVKGRLFPRRVKKKKD
ncbi:UDP-glucuronosyltransferase 2C1 [Penaeus vannamei]|uniref:UDP-glucuronosyltransferase 2C1 n=1 Tax=Penaeus vannamei TaxID=6689 RepID=A0A3R7MDU6_PENVA|nr:UDP-glucuronosyltransferase 2B19-like [Penaeus vannamei]ROT79971.1 UDP-glucuronosyltransferase 2C1 [Penaeus vannamei]